MASLLQRPVPAEGPKTVTDESDQPWRGGVRIRCPRCAWEPRREDRWMCRCGHVWNTFDTGGVCPACRYAWEHTRCLRCHEWSPHRDWYARDA